MLGGKRFHSFADLGYNKYLCMLILENGILSHSLNVVWKLEMDHVTMLCLIL